MNAAYILNKSAALHSGNNQKNTLLHFNISEALNSIDASFLSGFANLEVSADGKLQSYNRSGLLAPFNNSVAVNEPEGVASEQVYFLTQVILNTLNTEPSQFHDMFDIPGLEAEGWDTLASVAQYLIGQGWLESKAGAEKLLVKLTLEGKLYLRNHNAWS